MEDGLVGVAADVIHTPVDVGGYPFRDLRLSAALTEIQHHDIFQMHDIVNGLELLTLSGIVVDELVCLLNVHPARNCGEHPHFCYCADKKIFRIAQEDCVPYSLLSFRLTGQRTEIFSACLYCRL